MSNLITLFLLFIGLSIVFYLSSFIINRLFFPFKQKSIKKASEKYEYSMIGEVLNGVQLENFHSHITVTSCKTGFDSICPSTAENAMEILEKIPAIAEHASHLIE